MVNARLSERGFEIDEEISLLDLGSGNIKINSQKNLSNISELKDKFQKIVAISDFNKLDNEKYCSIGEAFSAAFYSFKNSEISKNTLKQAGFSSPEKMELKIKSWLDESRNQQKQKQKGVDWGRER